MKYILCVDTQPRINPSEDIRKYIIEIDELRRKDDVFDSLIITNTGQVTVSRKIGIADGETYKLDEEVIEELYYINVELFDGVNYVYIENIEGLNMTLDYVLKNDTNDSYPTSIQMHSAITQSANAIIISVGQTLENYSTTTEMNAAIQAKADEINLVVATKVGEDEVISSINQTSEQIKIIASKMALEGYTTINGGFAVDVNGNASIANGAVIIDNTGIKMADNTQIVGGQGLMTNLQFVGELSSQNANNMFSKFWWYNSGTMVFLSDYILINADIPSNFTIVSANIKLVEHPVYWNNYSRYGYVRDIGLYEIDSNSKLIANYQTSMDTYSGMVSRISNCWGENKTTTWSPTTPSDSNYGIQTVKSIDLKSILESDPNITFAIRSDYTKTYNQSTEQQDNAENTCFLTAILDVYGFMAF